MPDLPEPVYDPHAASQRLIELQAKRGLTGRQLAQRMGAGESDVSRLRNASRVNPGPKLWTRAAKALGTSTEWLLFGEGPVDVDSPEEVSIDSLIRYVDAMHVKLDRILAAIPVTVTLTRDEARELLSAAYDDSGHELAPRGMAKLREALGEKDSPVNRGWQQRGERIEDPRDHPTSDYFKRHPPQALGEDDA